jgi:hypothetical protein
MIMVNYEKFVTLYQKCRENKNAEITNMDIMEDGRIAAFDISGFSKSGSITISFMIDGEDGLIKTTERYNEYTYLNDYDGLVKLAWNWYQHGKERGFSLPHEWVEDFARLGLVRETKTYTEA